VRCFFVLVLPQRITVTWNGGNRKHFESLGYKYTKRNDSFEVDVQELLEGSNYEVQVQCDFCGILFTYPYSKYLRASKNRISKVSCSSVDCKSELKKEIAESLRFTIEQVRKVYEENGCILLENEYKGLKEPMRFQCHCGNEDTKTFDHFKYRNSCCRECANKRRIEERRFSYEEVYLYFKENGCELLEKSYANNSQPLRYICECGNESTIRFYNFQLGNRCEDCGNKKRAESRRHTYDYVIKAFEDEGCQLLETEYKDGHTPMRYICVCGREDKKSLQKFLFGQRCRSCYLDNNRGENNPAWNPDKTDEEREYGRILDGYKQWKKECLARDDYTCQVCNIRGGDLHIHHIFNYSTYREFRIEILNGITLCQDCHKGESGFHGIFGNCNATPEQFLEFLKIKNCLVKHLLIETRIRTLYKHLTKQE
jgi:hypothetical protein